MSSDMAAEIRSVLEANKASYTANDNISDFIAHEDLGCLQEQVAEKVEELLRTLLIDTESDPNTQDTANRVAKMFIHEVFKGRYYPRPDITFFPNTKRLDELYVVGPITVRSACSHHLVPIIGQCWVGVIPGEKIIGLSKFNRLVEWIMARPQIQEEAAVQLADEIERLIKPKGLAVVIKAQHLCMTWRGVKDNQTQMTTSIMRGLFRDKPEARAEFMDFIKGDL